MIREPSHNKRLRGFRRCVKKILRTRQRRPHETGVRCLAGDGGFYDSDALDIRRFRFIVADIGAIWLSRNGRLRGFHDVAARAQAIRQTD